MILVETVQELRSCVSELRGSIGFVPTMGALHAGHQSLMVRAKEQTDHVVVSIFVNPSQFGPGEDFEQYPRDRESDLERCAAVGVALVWFPRLEEIYPPGCETIVELEHLGRHFEGEARPGHFRGVATVVSKLFNALGPQKAFFGLKDLQQFFLIKKMTRDLLWSIEILGVETARDEHGLALSSRNSYLDAEERLRAAALFRALSSLREHHSGGMKRAEELRALFCEELRDWEGASLERFDLLASDLSRSFEEGESVESGFCAVALRYRGVRLIDNIELCC